MKPYIDNMPLVTFNAQEHKYYVEGREVPSANQIINKVLGTSFDPNNIFVRTAIEKGTFFHKEVEKFVKEGIEPSLPMVEFDNFVALCKEHDLKWSMSEKIVYNKIGNYEYAGTLDLYSQEKKELSDIKTGSVKALKKWQVQESLYAYALMDMYGYEVERLSILWLHNEESEYITVPLLPREFIVSFLEQYYTDKPKEEYSLKCLDEKAIFKLETGLSAIERLEEEIKEYKAKILEEMEARGITQIKLGVRTVSYVAPSIRKSIDSKKLKEEMPDVFNKYLKETKVKGSIRIQ